MDTTVTITLSDPAGLVLPQSVEQRVIAAATRVLSALEVMVATPPSAQSRPEMPVSFVIALGTRDNYDDPDRRCRVWSYRWRPAMMRTWYRR